MLRVCHEAGAQQRLRLLHKQLSQPAARELVAILAEGRVLVFPKLPLLKFLHSCWSLMLLQLS